jgi:S1-C subfamily serine protease
VFDDSFDLDPEDDEDSLCPKCDDPLCPGCGPTTPTRLVQFGLVLFSLFILVVVGKIVFGGNDGSGNRVREEAATLETPAETLPSRTTAEETTPETAAQRESGQAIVSPSGNPTAVVVDSVVQVVVFSGSERCGWGSGTVIGDSLTVITNHHVIQSTVDCPVTDIEVWTVDSLAAPPRPTHNATLVAVDEDADLARLKLDPVSSTSRNLIPVPLNINLDLGDDIFTLGFPSIGGNSITVSKGVASGITRLDGVDWIKTDASVTGGSSGGAAVNDQGDLVGVPTMASIGEDGEVIDCRNVTDTNADGEIDEFDTCQPIGGFLNLLSPASRVQQLLAQPLDANGSSLNLPQSLPRATNAGSFVDGVIDTENRQVVAASWAEAQKRSKASIAWTGSLANCDPGSTSSQFKEEVLHRVKWYRAMAGVDPNITLNAASNGLAQHAALVMAANFDLSHEPTSSWECFTSEAFEGASHSNLHLGWYGTRAIDSYIDDEGEGNETVGHRRWLLDPLLTSIGSGDTPNSNALWVINDTERERYQVREEGGFVMWPPRGFVPRNTIHPRWSISHPSADFDSVKIEIFDGQGTYLLNEFITDDNLTGNSNALIFEWKRPPVGVNEIKVRVREIQVDSRRVELIYSVFPID